MAILNLPEGALPLSAPEPLLDPEAGEPLESRGGDSPGLVSDSPLAVSDSPLAVSDSPPLVSDSPPTLGAPVVALQIVDTETLSPETTAPEAQERAAHEARERAAHEERERAEQERRQARELRELLLQDAVLELDAFYREHPGALRPPFATHRAYVEYVYALHRPWIERWGAWRWHGPCCETSAIDLDELYRLQDRMRSECLAQGMKFYSWPDPDTPDTLPRPVLTESFATTTWEKEEDQQLYYAVGYRGALYAPIRKGQRVTRAVLAEVRKRFKDHPEYVAAWERVSEQLGHLYARRHGVAVTLSCSPADFLRLGHYGESSCYHTGDSFERSKLNLTMIRGSVVLLIYTDSEMIAREVGGGSRHHPSQETPQGRAWGVLSDLGLGMSNFYKESWDKCSPALRDTVRLLLDREESFEMEDTYAFEGLHDEYVYVNDDSCLFFAGCAERDLLRSEIEEAIGEALRNAPLLTPGVYCNSCEEYSDPDDVSYCASCRDSYCSDCISHCSGCEEYYCSGCMEMASCGESRCYGDFCEDCARGCKDCSEFFCQSHEDAHLKLCTACDASVCTDCLQSCTECGEGYCNHHADGELQECCGCEAQVCSECRKECDKCEGALCSSCATEVTVTVCDSCAP